MKRIQSAALLALALASCTSFVMSQTVLNASFETDRIGSRPTRILPGLPHGDELLYLGSGSHLSVIAFPTAPSHRALQITAPPGSRPTLVELASAGLPAGPRSQINGYLSGSFTNKGRTTITLSRDSSAALLTLELRDGAVTLGRLSSDGTIVERIRFARFLPGRPHEIQVAVQTATGKSQVAFQEIGGVAYLSPVISSPGASAIGNAKTLSFVIEYAPAITPDGAYLLDDAQLWINRRR